MSRNHIVAIANQKGGVGKSTTAINLSSALAKSGHRVLIIDMDPQGHSTLGLGFNTSHILTVAEALVDANALDKIYDTYTPNLHILPSDLSLAAAEKKISTMPFQEFRLRNSIEKIKDDYDYIIIDCPPTFGSLAINVFTAAGHVIMPVALGYFSFEGMNSFLDTLKYVNTQLGAAIRHTINILGVLVTFYDNRTKLAREIEHQIRELFDVKIFKTTIPQNIKLNEAQSKGKSIFDYCPECSGAVAYQSLSNEFIQRISHV
jgi:chromosome partitioning protein